VENFGIKKLDKSKEFGKIGYMGDNNAERRGIFPKAQLSPDEMRRAIRLCIERATAAAKGRGDYGGYDQERRDEAARVFFQQAISRAGNVVGVAGVRVGERVICVASPPSGEAEPRVVTVQELRRMIGK
jgi:hypothetical protein